MIIPRLSHLPELGPARSDSRKCREVLSWWGMGHSALKLLSGLCEFLHSALGIRRGQGRGRRGDFPLCYPFYKIFFTTTRLDSSLS